MHSVNCVIQVSTAVLDLPVQWCVSFVRGVSRASSELEQAIFQSCLGECFSFFCDRVRVRVRERVRVNVRECHLGLYQLKLQESLRPLAGFACKIQVS